jgi:adenosine deaminase
MKPFLERVLIGRLPPDSKENRMQRHGPVRPTAASRPSDRSFSVSRLYTCPMNSVKARSNRAGASVGLVLGGLLSLVLSGCATGGATPPAGMAVSEQTSLAPVPAPIDRAMSSEETATIRAFEALRGDSARLEVFLRAMPKGGDLHTHLSGAVYAESFLTWASADGACLHVTTLVLAPAPACGDSLPVLAAALAREPDLHDRLVDAFSMRGYRPEAENGHDRFFATFGRFSAATHGRTGDMLAEVAARAAEGGERYLEIMFTPDGGSLARLGLAAGWDEAWGRLRQKLLDSGLRDTVKSASRLVAEAEARRDSILGCGGAHPDPGCAVTMRYDYQVLRAMPRTAVFAQILGGFEMAHSDPRVVGLNLVQPEDDPVAMRDYTLHMRIIRHLSALYPDVRVTLHAGELAEGMVPPEGLRFHIRQAVEIAGARRIGHGVDVLQEDDADGLLREMARRHVMVEINLSSNDEILGVRGGRHPLRTYLAYGVPVALSTDDEGVSRSDITVEYRKAVEDQGVGYTTLKAMARNSLEYAFVEGASLWADYATLEPVTACAAAAGGLDSAECRAFTDANTKARLEASLERGFRAFEKRVAGGDWPVRR